MPENLNVVVTALMLVSSFLFTLAISTPYQVFEADKVSLNWLELLLRFIYTKSKMKPSGNIKQY